MAIVFPTLHLLEELLQAGRQCGFWPQALLEPFTHGIADVTAGLAIKLIWIVIDLGHRHGTSLGEFHLACFSDVLPRQVATPNLVSVPPSSRLEVVRRITRPGSLAARKKPRRKRRGQSQSGEQSTESMGQ